MLSSKKNRERPKPWLREIEFTKAVLHNGNLIMGNENENGVFIANESGLDFKTEVRKGFFEHWGIDFIKPTPYSDQFVQITVAFIIDAVTGELIKVSDTSAIRFL